MLIHENKIDKIIKESIRKYLNESKINFSKMIFVAFGSNKFDLDKVTPVDFANRQSKIINKVIGGVWASPLHSKYGWAEWCNAEDFRLRTLSQHFLFTLKRNAKIYVIDTFDDLKKISTAKNILGQKCINFITLYQQKYDGIFVTANAVSALRNDMYGYAGLTSWDVESICIFNSDVIVPIEEDAFEKARINKYGKAVQSYDDYDDDDFSNADRKYLQMQSDFDRYSNQNIHKDMSKLFKGKHPAILAQQHGNAKATKLARKFNGTIQSGL